MLLIWQRENTFQSFADHPAAQGYPEIKHGTLADLESWAKARNEHGYGIYVAVNGTDGEGRKVENIIDLRAWYIDIDGLPTDEHKHAKVYDLLSGPLPPSAIVKTKNGLHCYFFAQPGQEVDAGRFKETVKGIAHYYSGDAAVSDISRVLRLPGYSHKKDPADPYEIKIIWEDEGLLYCEAELQRAYPLPLKSKTPPLPAAAQTYVNAGTAVDDWTLILEALAGWPAPDGEKHRVLMQVLGVGLKFSIPESRAVADLIPIVSAWDTRDDPANSVRQRAHWAYHSGKPTTVAGLRSLGVAVPKLSRPKETSV